MRKLMIASIIATGALAHFLIAGTLFFGTGIGLKQFLSPGETPSVAITMIAAR